MFLKTIDKSIYKKNTFDNLEKYKELWFINNGFISQDKIIDIFYDAYSDREIRFDTLDKFFSNNRQLLLKYLPELHIQLKTIASNELTDLLKNAGLKIVNKNETKQKTKQDSKSKSKESSKSKGDAKSNQSTTPGNFSTNTNEFMNQVFSKNESSGDGNVERESDNLLLVDNDNNSVNETIQKSLIDTIMKITIMKSHSIILEWINHFDILFSNFDYSVGGSINDWINVSQYQKLLEQIDNINKNAESEAAKIATKWVQEHYKDIAKFVPALHKGEKGEKGDKGDKPSKQELKPVIKEVVDKEITSLQGKTYTKKQINGFLTRKANKAEVYKKNEVDDKISNITIDTSKLQDKLFEKSKGGQEWSKIDKLPLGMNNSRISEVADSDVDDDAANVRTVNKIIDEKTDYVDKLALRLNIVSKLPIASDERHLKFVKTVERFTKALRPYINGNFETLWFCPGLNLNEIQGAREPAFVRYGSVAPIPGPQVRLSSTSYELVIDFGDSTWRHTLKYPLYLEDSLVEDLNYLWVFIYKRFPKEKIFDWDHD